MNRFDMEKCPLDGVNLIEASAGTGKTHTIAGLFLRLVLEKGLDVDRILVVTFTVAAMEELRGRIRNLLRELYLLLNGTNSAGSNEMLNMLGKKFRGNRDALLRIKDSLLNFDVASISTIHSFCQAILLENAFESRVLYDSEVVTDQKPLLKEVVYDFWRLNFYDVPKIISMFIHKIGLAPVYFHNLVNHRSIDPSIAIIPENEVPDIDSAADNFFKLHEMLKKSWQKHKSDVESIIMESDSLNRQRYRTASIPGWMEEMDLYFKSSNCLNICKNFEKFTIQGIKAAVKKNCDEPEHPFFIECDKFYSSYNSVIELLKQYLAAKKLEFFEYAERETASRNNVANKRSFDDLLMDMYSALQGEQGSDLSAAVRRRYGAALIDEFQDTDPVQCKILQDIFNYEDTPLYLIGDPKQAIYSFRGGDIFAYLNALESVSRRYTLGVNWRSDPVLIEGVNTIFSAVSNPFVFDWIGFHEISHPEHPEREELTFNGEKETPMNLCILDKKYADDKNKKKIKKSTAEAVAAQSVAFEIKKLIIMGKEGKALIGERSLVPGDIAVLVRKKRQAEMVKKCLDEIRIPSVIYGAGSVFQTMEAEEMWRIISAVCEPGNYSLVYAALSTDILGYNGNDIFNAGENSIEHERITGKFFEYNRMWHANDFITFFNTLLKENGVKSRILSYHEGERKMTNILHLAELLHSADVSKRFGLEGLANWLSEMISEDSGEENQLRLESDDNAVRIITIHRSKGLEYPVVFCPYLWEGSRLKSRRNSQSGMPFIFHDRNSGNMPVLDIGTENQENIDCAEIETLAENVRLMYVALTRAKHRCYFYWGNVRGAETSAAAYLLHWGDDGSILDSLNQLEGKIKSYSHDEVLSDAKRLEKSSMGSLKLTIISKTDLTGDLKSEYKDENLSVRKFKGYIDKDWMVTSYSALVAGVKYDPYLRDSDRHGTPLNAVNNDNIYNSIFHFPRGAKAGNLIHEIFENIDFRTEENDSVADLIGSKVSLYGYDPEWVPVLHKMVDNVLGIEIDHDNSLTLNKIRSEQKLIELDFYFPITKITSDGILGIFKNVKKESDSGETIEIIEKLDFKTREGFIRGFIDLVFIYEGKYYIVDWKSNFLGDDIKNYNQDSLLKEMISSNYVLQYQLYSLALHRYLSAKCRDYNYNTDFGGVYYIFVRGIDSEIGKSYGVYHDKPSFELITSLNNYMSDD